MNYVYKLLDKSGNVLYVGKTNDLKRRLGEHIANQEWSYEIDSLYYAVCRDNFEQSTYEKYYIIKSNPKYNKQDKSFSTHIILPDLQWKKFEDIENFNEDEEMKKKLIFILDNWLLINEIIDGIDKMLDGVQDPRDIDACDIYAMQVLVEELNKRRNIK